MTTTPKPAALVPRDVAVRAIHEPLAGAELLAAKATAAIDHARNLTIRPGVAEARHAAGWDRVYAEALAALDELVAVVRPALEETRRRAAAFGEQLAAEEAAAAAAAEEARRRAAFDAAVARGVQAEEAARLAAVEADVRARMQGSAA